jgi:hypothetical protein
VITPRPADDLAVSFREPITDLKGPSAGREARLALSARSCFRTSVLPSTSYPPILKGVN